MQQVVAGQLAARLLNQLLERRAILGEPPLQRPLARAQLFRHVLEPRSPPRQQRFQDALDLLADRSRSERLLQLGLELRRDGREQVRAAP